MNPQKRKVSQITLSGERKKEEIVVRKGLKKKKHVTFKDILALYKYIKDIYAEIRFLKERVKELEEKIK